MSLARRLFPSFDGPARVSPYFYVPPKRRWWPMLAAFAAGGVCVLGLFGAGPQSEEANVAQKPIVHQVSPGGALQASSLPQPADATPAPSATPAADAARPETGVAGAQAGMMSAPPAAEMDKAPEARAKGSSRQARAKSSNASSSRHAARKSRRHEPSYDTFAGDDRDRDFGDSRYRNHDHRDRDYGNWGYWRRDDRDRAYGDGTGSRRSSDYAGERFGFRGDRFGGSNGPWGGWFSGDN